MNTWNSERQLRNIHRWIAMVAIGFLFLSLLTGLLWANAPFLYWADRYKEKVHAVTAPPLESAAIPLSAAIRVSRDDEDKALVERVTFRTDAGRLFYEVRLRVGGKPRAVLVDAMTGLRSSPLSSELARDMAKQYVRDPAEVVAVASERYTPRKKHQAQDAIRVRFNDRHQTEIVLDSQTGEILEDEGRWRKLHFFVMQLHQLNFFGFEKTLLNVPGLPLFLMGITGLLLCRKQIVRKRRASKVQDLPGDFIPQPKRTRLDEGA